MLNKNLDNQWYGSKGGADTMDSVFLLSFEEVLPKSLASLLIGLMDRLQLTGQIF